MIAPGDVHSDVDRPAEAPAYTDTRAQLAAAFLRGSGVEIGALNWSLSVPPQASVTYVDRMTVEDLRAEYPALGDVELSRVDVLDDGERLGSFEEESVDFIVANHFLEHCEDPIATIETHLWKLRPGGVLFYAVPDKRYTFDFRRPRTPLAHVVGDYENGPDGSRRDHFLEWERLVYESGMRPPDEDEVRRRADESEATGQSIHFHVWTQADLLELILHCQWRFGTFEIEAIRRHSIENIVVLRKHGGPIEESPAGPTAVLPQADPEPPTSLDRQMTLDSAISPPPDGSSGCRVPLSALRMALDPRSAQARWVLDWEECPGRGLVQPADSVVTFSLRLAGPVRLSSRVRLASHDWRDLRGGVRAWLGVEEGGAGRRELWSGSLECSGERGRLGGLPVDCELPASSNSLLLGLDMRPPSSGSPVGRAIWVEPEIIDPAAPPPTSVMAPRASARSSAGRDRGRGPLISVLTPVHDPPIAMLEEAIASVRGQSFGDWELCLVDDGSSDPRVIETLRRHAAGDERLHLVRREQAGGIAVATTRRLRSPAVNS